MTKTAHAELLSCGGGCCIFLDFEQSQTNRILEQLEQDPQLCVLKNQTVKSGAAPVQNITVIVQTLLESTGPYVPCSGCPWVMVFKRFLSPHIKTRTLSLLAGM